jgi:malate dehydrogenase (oxaloacetate-decarboxylating)(NADP+)
MDETRAENLRQAALDYHEFPKPGKLEIRATKPLANGRDLARAYSPGVAEACLEIKADPATASRYTGRGNMVGVSLIALGHVLVVSSAPSLPTTAPI